MHFRGVYLLYNVTDMPTFGSGWPVAGEFELLVLLALMRLGNGAFGAAIHREIVTRTGRDLRTSAAEDDANTICSTPPASAPSSERGARLLR